MAVETDLVRGLAQRLATAGIGTWSLVTAYTPGQVGIYEDEPGPDVVEAITIATYPVADPVDATSVIGIQFRIRSASAATIRDRADAIFGSIHALWGVTFGACRAQQILRRSASTPAPRTPGGPLIRTDNYYATIHHPTTNRAT